MLKLFYSPGSCALASHIALEETGAPYEAVRIDFAAEEQLKPAYLAINPKGRVPALVTERGILTESPAILTYIAQTFPQAQLAPLADAFALAQMQAFNSYLCATVHVAHAHLRRATRWSDDAAGIESMIKKAPQNMTECFSLIEREMLQGPWVMGDTYSVADPYLFTLARWLKGYEISTAQFPKLHALMQRIALRPAVQRVMAVQQLT
jgi:glutathione S-transferase